MQAYSKQQAGGASLTVGEALAASLPSFHDARMELDSLPVSSEVLAGVFGGPYAPQTWAEAHEIVAERVEAKKKKDLKRQDSRNRQNSKPGGPLQGAGPGARIGAVHEKNAFWMVMEEYFRDISRADLALLLPASLSPYNDPSLRVPHLGPCSSSLSPAHQLLNPRATSSGRRADRRAPSLALLNAPSSSTFASAPFTPTTATLPAPAAATAGKLESPASSDLKMGDIMQLGLREEATDCCLVCRGGDSYQDNKIVFCETCNAGFHQSCYGIPVIPTGPWDCTSCRFIKRTGKTPQCVACPVQGGALKPCVSESGQLREDSDWMHLFCCYWLPEMYVSHGNQASMEPIEGLANINKGRRGLQCCLCKSKYGLCIQCSVPQCRLAFHATCARQAGLLMDENRWRAYCHKHSKSMASRLTSAPQHPFIGPSPASASAVPVDDQNNPTDRHTDLNSFLQLSNHELHPQSLATPLKVEATVEPPPGAAALDARPGSLLLQCTGTEVAMLAMAAVSLGPSSLRSRLAEACGASSVEALLAELQTAASEGGKDVSPALTASLKGWLASLQTQIALGGSQASDEGREGNAVTERGGGDSDGVTPGGAWEQQGRGSVSGERDKETEMTVPQALGVWGRLDLHDRIARVAAEALGSGNRVPIAPLSHVAKLQEMAAELAAEEGWGRGLVHPYLELLLNTKTTLDRESSLPLPLEPPGTLIARTGLLEGGDCEAAMAEKPAKTGDEELLAVAPDDEVLGELLALQGELVFQAAQNRAVIGKLLPAVLASLPQQLIDAEKRAEAEAEMDAYVEHVREERRNAKLERKQQQLREQQALLEAAAAASPRITAVQRATRSDSPADGKALPLGPLELLDPLAARKDDEDAVCVVCGEGHSDAPNVIVFCERCDIGVHQACYNVATIPAGEWLCWPCLRHEEELGQRGYSRAQIRAPRWLRKSKQEGGSSDTRCGLCPNMGGAFRKTIDGKQWLHEVCAAWHPEVKALPTGSELAFSGLADIPQGRWGATCGVCNTSSGAVVPCAAGPGICNLSFHPLCARRVGWPLVSNSHNCTAAFCGIHRDLASRWLLAAAPPPFAQVPPAAKLPGLPSPAMTAPQATVSSAQKPQTPKPPASSSSQALKQKKPRASKRVQVLAKELELLQRNRVEMEQLRLLMSCVIKRERSKRSLNRAARDLCALLRQHEQFGGGGSVSPVAVRVIEQLATLEGRQLQPEHTPCPLVLAYACFRNLPAMGLRAKVGSRRRASSLDGVDNPSKRQRGGASGASLINLGHRLMQQHQEGGGGGEEEGYQQQDPLALAPEKLDRERLMTDMEAKSANGQLPAGFLYVPTDSLKDERG